ncbi:MAG: hypothetical protein K9L59_02665 [Desulfobacterales bacterium]|nr:hypothetical protein [Desulfobacterales bacterium]MCF8079671.1 hypothetical protein [Desulfobacterales bacterium]
MAGYHLALTGVCLISLFVLIRKLLACGFKPMSRITGNFGKSGQTDMEDSGKKSALDRVRDWVFPKIPMV